MGKNEPWAKNNREAENTPWENHYPADAAQMNDHIKTKVL